ncbi:MAG: hypothetical protein WBN75_10315 [Verrucomicrobiia bacterium]|jgi:hypothetical protein
MGEWKFVHRDGVARLAGAWAGVFLNQIELQQVYSIINYAEKKKDDTRQCGAQTPKQQPTRSRSKTGADA